MSGYSGYSLKSNVSVFPHPPHLPLIAPSILAADFGEIGRQVNEVEKAGADLIHVDIMDGHFVPNLTMGPDMVQALRRSCRLMPDVHLMVTDPQNFIEPFLDAGAGHISFHIEAPGLARCSASDLIRRIHARGATAGVALNPSTPVAALESILSLADLVLVMSVHPGFTGQNFMPETLSKVTELHRRLSPHQRLQIDGGIGLQTAPDALRAGADVLVAGAAIFRAPDWAATIQRLRGE